METVEFRFNEDGARLADVEALRAVRHRAFHKEPPPSLELKRLASQGPDHSFLINPAAHLVYVYLVRYVVEASVLWTQKTPRTLDVLDWGCGKGHVSLLLRENGVRPVSADRVSDAGHSAFGQATPILKGAGIEVAPLEDDVALPFADASFDAVLSFGVLEHVPHDASSLQEISRVLRRRGLFFCFFLPYTGSWTQRLAHLRGDRYHDRLYGRRQLKRLLSGAGLGLADAWFRQLFPKNSVPYPKPWWFERLDQTLTEHSPLRFLATNLECVAVKGLLPSL